MATRKQDEDLAHQAFAVLMAAGNGLAQQLRAGRISLASALTQAESARNAYLAYRDKYITVDSVRRAMVNEYDPSRCEYICAFDKLVSTFPAIAPKGPAQASIYIAPVVAKANPNISPASYGAWDEDTGGDIPIVDIETIGTLSESQGATGGGGLLDMLNEPVGPMPVWAWGVLGIIGYEVVVKGGKL